MRVSAGVRSPAAELDALGAERRGDVGPSIHEDGGLGRAREGQQPVGDPGQFQAGGVAIAGVQRHRGARRGEGGSADRKVGQGQNGGVGHGMEAGKRPHVKRSEARSPMPRSQSPAGMRFFPAG